MIVGLFVDHIGRRFSITARSEQHPHLEIMKEDEAARGFGFVLLTSGQTKQRADAFKAIQIAAYENAGYTYVPRASTF